MEEVVAGYPGMFTNVETYLAERISEVISGESEPVVVRLLGDDLQVLRDKAPGGQAHARSDQGRRGGQRVAAERHPPDPGRRRPRQGQGRRHQAGRRPARAATLMSGEEVGDIFRANRTYDVQVWSTPASRDSIDDIGNILVDTPSGDKVRLGDIASVTVRPTPNFIQHEGSTRRLDVGAEIEGRDLGEVARDVESGLKNDQVPARDPGAGDRPVRRAPEGVQPSPRLRDHHGDRDLPDPVRRC